MRVVRLAARQHGCVSAEQLAGCGVTPGSIARWCAKGWLLRLHRGVYLVGPLRSPLAPPMAALLAVGPGAVLSHQTAAVLYELLPATAGDVHVTAPGRRPRSRPGIRTHTTGPLPQSAVRTRHGMPVTAPERTLCDLAALLSPRVLDRIVEEAHVRRVVDPGALGAGPGAATVRAVIDRYVTPAFTRSEAERRMLDLVRDAGLPTPRANARAGPYEVDLLWPAERLIVEVDGYAFHGTRAAFERDRLRDAELQRLGFRVLRVTWHRLATAPLAVAAQLAAALAIRAAAAA